MKKDKEIYNLEMIDQKLVIRVPPMKYNLEDKDKFEIQIKELLRKRLTIENISPHSSSAFVVRNHAEIKWNKVRLVINYRKLNGNTIFGDYYIPNKEELINNVQKVKIFSKFDAKSGYWQVRMHQESIKYTAISTPQGQYDWLVMPFVLKNVPQIFQRQMDNIFKKHSKYCIVYIDDILVFNETKQDHKNHFLVILKETRNHDQIIGEQIIEAFKERVEFLGIIIDKIK